MRAWVCGCAWEKRRRQQAEGRDDEGTERRGIVCVAWVAGWIGVIGEVCARNECMDGPQGR